MSPERPVTGRPTGKADLVKTLDAYRARRGEFRVVDVPPLQYLMVDGYGDPNVSPDYASGIEALYPLAYALKFASKRVLGRDYVVPPLEGLWWAEDMETFTARRDKSQWDWTLMILTPDWIGREAFEEALAAVRAKKAPPRIDDVRLETLEEGLCVQTLHLGPYDDEGPVLERMHDEIIPGEGLRRTGIHHEVYFSDARRTAPARLRTLLRQPVERA